MKSSSKGQIALLFLWGTTRRLCGIMGVINKWVGLWQARDTAYQAHFLERSNSTGCWLNQIVRHLTRRDASWRKACRSSRMCRVTAREIPHTTPVRITVRVCRTCLEGKAHRELSPSYLMFLMLSSTLWPQRRPRGFGVWWARMCFTTKKSRSTVEEKPL